MVGMVSKMPQKINGNSQTGEGAMREVWELTPSDAGGVEDGDGVITPR